MASYIYLRTADGALIVTIDGAYIVLAGGDVGGCTVPLPPAARPWTLKPPPPNPITPEQFSPFGLIAIPLTLLEQLPDRIPTPPDGAPTTYTPADRLSVVQAVLATMIYDPALSVGCQAFAVTELVVAAIRLAYSDNVGYLKWEWPTSPAWDGHTCLRPSDGVRYWANVVAYSDGAFYWILGGLGGYGLEAYWVYGGQADPALFVAP